MLNEYYYTSEGCSDMETHLAFGEGSNESEDEAPEPPVSCDASGYHVAWMNSEAHHTAL